MTIAELYEYAKELEIENLPICLRYECNDDWYSFDRGLTRDDVSVVDKMVVFDC
jgi:hypothetical protein